jgi:HK97 family phage major capsid protein
VGFIEHAGHWGQDEKRGTEDEDSSVYYFDDIELMEISLVSVPSNPEALAYRTFEATGVENRNEDNTHYVHVGEMEPIDTSGTITTTGDVPIWTGLDSGETQTDLTKQVTKSNNMEKEEKKDLAPEISKVEVEVKLDEEKLGKAIAENLPKAEVQEPLPGAPAPEVTAEEAKSIKQYSVRKAILQKAYPDEAGKLDGLELEMHQEAVKEATRTNKALSGVGIPSMFTRATLQATVDAAGGYSVATELPGFIDTLKNNMATVKAGATLMTGLEGDVSIPKLSANSTATWRTELGTATQSDPTFTAVTMTPHRLTTYTVFSQQLLRQSSLDIEKIVRENLFYSVANALEAAAYEGDGTSQVPVGILNASVNDATHGSSSPTVANWPNIVNMESMVAVDNALAAKMAYIMKATAAGKLKTTEKASSTGQFIYGQDPLLGGTVNGYPAHITNVFTDDTVLFGNWAELMIGQWGGLDLIVNPYAGDIYATVRVVIAGYYDLAVKHPESFARINDLGV